MNVLKEQELEAALQRLPEWKLEQGKLLREWKFKDFVEAMKFVNQVAVAAELENHHPDIDIRYNQVRLGLVTHDAGGITQRDVRMAEKLGSTASE